MLALYTRAEAWTCEGERGRKAKAERVPDRTDVGLVMRWAGRLQQPLLGTPAPSMRARPSHDIPASHSSTREQRP